MSKKILITGGSGFIGTNAVEVFRAGNFEVLNIDIKPPRNPEHKSEWLCVDICDEIALIKVFADFKPAYVLHLAARTDMDGDKVEDYHTNIEGVKNIINTIRRTGGVERTVFASSRLVCEIGYMPSSETDYNATTAYGMSKVEGEKIVRKEAAQHFPWTILRPTSIWGPWFGVPYRDFFSTVQSGLYIHPTKRNVFKSYGYVENCIHQIQKILVEDTKSASLYKTFYLCDFEPFELKNWADLISKHLGVRKAPYVPYLFVKIAALGGDLLKKVGLKSIPITSFRLDNLLSEMVHENSKMEQICGPLPCTLDQGVKRTCTWLKNHSD